MSDLRDIKLEIKVEKQDTTQNETGDNSVEWNLQDISDQDNIYSSAIIKEEYGREEDSKSSHKSDDFVEFESIYIKEEKLENQNETEDVHVENYKEDLIGHPDVDFKNETYIALRTTEAVKDERVSVTEISRDSSRCQAVEKICKENYIITKNLVGGKNTCEICKKKFNLKCHLVKHMRIHSVERPYECEICKKKFNVKEYLTNHMRIHSAERIYDCEICKKMFSSKAYLTIHMRIHSGERPYECEICKQKFSQQGHLVQHIRIHSCERPFECKICMKKFNRKNHLDLHVRIHSGEKPYECEICKKNFNVRGNLANHMRTHTGERPYVCGICNKTFNKKGILTNHMRTHSE